MNLAESFMVSLDFIKSLLILLDSTVSYQVVLNFTSAYNSSNIIGHLRHIKKDLNAQIL